MGHSRLKLGTVQANLDQLVTLNSSCSLQSAFRMGTPHLKGNTVVSEIQHGSCPVHHPSHCPSPFTMQLLACFYWPQLFLAVCIHYLQFKSSLGLQVLLKFTPQMSQNGVCEFFSFNLLYIISERSGKIQTKPLSCFLGAQKIFSVVFIEFRVEEPHF